MNDRGTFERAFDWLSSTPGQVFLAGLIGGILRWLHTEKTWKGGVASILSGLASAWYLGPTTAVLLADRFGVEPDNARLVAGVSFVVGVGGISLVAFIISVFRGINTRAGAQKGVQLFWAMIDAIVSLRGPRP